MRLVSINSPGEFTVAAKTFDPQMLANFGQLSGKEGTPVTHADLNWRGTRHFGMREGGGLDTERTSPNRSLALGRKKSGATSRAYR